MSTLWDIAKGFIGKIAQEAKEWAELNNRTDSNIIDTLNSLIFTNAITKEKIVNHIREKPFQMVCWQQGMINKIRNEQQNKADHYVKQNINKIEFKDQEENGVLTVPDEVRNINGFTAIPPYLRIFPSNLALQGLKKNLYVENSEESELLKIKNKRSIEDKIVAITLKENEQKHADDVNVGTQDHAKGKLILQAFIYHNRFSSTKRTEGGSRNI